MIKVNKRIWPKGVPSEIRKSIDTFNHKVKEEVVDKVWEEQQYSNKDKVQAFIPTYYLWRDTSQSTEEAKNWIVVRSSANVLSLPSPSAAVIDTVQGGQRVRGAEEDGWIRLTSAPGYIALQDDDGKLLEHQGPCCSSRMPFIGDRVMKSKYEDDSNDDGYRLKKGEVAEVVGVDSDGDFKLKDPQGVVSGFRYRTNFFYFAEAPTQTLYLPMQAEGEQLLLPKGDGQYEVTVSEGFKGLGFRKTKDLKDKLEHPGVPNKTIVRGQDDGDGWLQIITNKAEGNMQAHADLSEGESYWCFELMPSNDYEKWERFRAHPKGIEKLG